MRSRIFSIRLPAELVGKINEAAKKRYISRSAFIREAVAEKLNREQTANKTEEIDWEKLLNKED